MMNERIKEINEEGKTQPKGFEFEFIFKVPVVRDGMVTLVDSTELHSERTN